MLAAATPPLMLAMPLLELAGLSLMLAVPLLLLRMPLPVIAVLATAPPPAPLMPLPGLLGAALPLLLRLKELFADAALGFDAFCGEGLIPS